MSKHQEKIKVVDEECIATSSNIHEKIEYGYWIHINHFFNCYPDCNIYLKSFDHFLKRKVINKQGLILIPLFHKIFNISNVVCCLICHDQNCYMCKNFKQLADGRKSSCSCNEDLRDDHAVNRINWFISNFKMCATMKERFSKSKAASQKNDNAKKTKGESGLKETNNQDIKSNVPNVNSECSDRLQCDCDESNAPSKSTGAIRKYSKGKATNKTVKLNENSSSKSQKINDGGNIREKKKKPLIIDDEKIQAHLNSSVIGKKSAGGKIKMCESLASDIQILTKDSFTRFVEKFDSLNAFGDQCLFCKLLGHFYDGKFCDVIIPDFCIADRRQTTCEKSFNEKDCFGKQYCLSVENAYVDAGVGPKLIGTHSKKHIPLIDLDKGMNFDKSSKYITETNFENPRSKIIKKKKMRMVSCSEEMKKKEKKE